MGDEPVSRSRRRSRSEVEQLVTEYAASGLGRTEFCRKHGLSWSTLNRYCKRGQARAEVTGVGPWVAVEVAGTGISSGAGRTSGLTVILSGGRRIEIARDFDADICGRGRGGHAEGIRRLVRAGARPPGLRAAQRARLPVLECKTQSPENDFLRRKWSMGMWQAFGERPLSLAGSRR